MSAFERLSADVIARVAKLPTSAVSDALDKLGLPGQVDGLRPMLAGARLCGQAVTLSYLPMGAAGGTVGEFLHLAEAGDVICIDNRGRLDCTVWGNILTEAAKAKGIAGTVIDGVNRDVGESRAYGYPIWSCAAHSRTGKDRVALQATNVPIVLGRVRVDPGDLISADDSCVVVIPLARAADVLRVAEEIEAKEALILRDIRAGIDLAEARRSHGYHALQTKGA
ncbi:regulator of RNase E activity RraA [Humitalea rosea]|uniref:Putative 4-hydroxy-4-methyl-2-oxoglutarate aldolase n=1 Tax=Humitalea rosea TaxID=990373 RepID=A0A2W7IMU9_9PROT|nr:RraA family protein [Humitalea rosea]PZW48258.1 regulator of RNase E activity RraA [Humitalea rosea]